MGDLADLMNPRLVLKRDLEGVMEGSGSATPLIKKRTKAILDPVTHVVIPDAQVTPGVDLRWIDWVGSYIAEALGERHNVTVVCLGDWWDMAGLSLYDKGKREMEGRRVVSDICVGNDAFARLDSLIPVKFTRHFLLGNHEDRITRAVSADAQLDGILLLDLLDTKGWTVHPFLEPVWLGGVCYSHYLYNWNSGRPYAGQNLETRVRQVGHSFTMGHQQGLKWARVDTVNGPHIGLVCGSCYLHHEDYRGLQAQDHWRGLVICNDVRDGQYDPSFISLRYLCRRYEGIDLEEYQARER